ncbi:hypothetical protein EIP91_001801 [Steccherinum ochraceum]|uniref:Uncharacterized protein n=1 Tax=Steccherinum ochraceum TaxID=92696 RepID=A0A4R0RPJ8_9APHY|nr:hypothetical protein EIP91_001801 [Steccherinum ochraceum]
MPVSDLLLFPPNPLHEVNFATFPEDDPHFEDVYCDFQIHTFVDDLQTYHRLKTRTGVPKMRLCKKYLAVKGNPSTFSSVTKALTNLSTKKNPLSSVCIDQKQSVINDALPYVILKKSRYELSMFSHCIYFLLYETVITSTPIIL